MNAQEARDVAAEFSRFSKEYLNALGMQTLQVDTGNRMAMLSPRIVEMYKEITHLEVSVKSAMQRAEQASSDADDLDIEVAKQTVRGDGLQDTIDAGLEMLAIDGENDLHAAIQKRADETRELRAKAIDSAQETYELRNRVDGALQLITVHCDLFEPWLFNALVKALT